LRWLLRACAQGDRETQFQAGQLYAARARTPDDLVEAYKWYTLAAEQGMPVGPEPFHALELRMTDEEVRKALELASDFRPCPE
jgi:TPR repeat protein